MRDAMRNCKLLVLDVDGVLTDGTKLYGREGEVIGKSFCDRDFTAIQRFESAGVRVCLLSADRNITEAIAKSRGIDYWYARNDDGSIDKLAYLPKLEAHYGVTRAQVAYVGDDLFDVPLLAALDLSFCPHVAPAVVHRAVRHVLPLRGGDGIVAALYDAYETD